MTDAADSTKPLAAIEADPETATTTEVDVVDEDHDDAPVMKLAETVAKDPDDEEDEEDEEDEGDGPDSDDEEDAPDSDESRIDTEPPPPPEDASVEGDSHAAAPRALALGDTVRFTHPHGEDGAHHDEELYVVALYPHGMADLAETHDGPAIVHAKVVDGAARLRDPSEDAEPPPATTLTVATEAEAVLEPPMTTPTPQTPQTLAEQLRARLQALGDGTAAPGPTLATATDAHFRAIHNFLNDMQNEDMFRTWVESLAPAQSAHMVALLHDPRANVTFGNGVAPAPAADATTAAPPADTATAPGSHGPPPASVDENNRRIAERFRGLGTGGVAVTVTTGGASPNAPAGPDTTTPPAASTPNAPPARTQPLARLPFLRQVVPVPVARQAPAASKPNLCVRGCRIDHPHHFS